MCFLSVRTIASGWIHNLGTYAYCHWGCYRAQDRKKWYANLNKSCGIISLKSVWIIHPLAEDITRPCTHMRKLWKMKSKKLNDFSLLNAKKYRHEKWCRIFFSFIMNLYSETSLKLFYASLKIFIQIFLHKITTFLCWVNIIRWFCTRIIFG